MGQCHARESTLEPEDIRTQLEDDDTSGPLVEDPLTSDVAPNEISASTQVLLPNPWVLSDYRGQIVQASQSAHTLFGYMNMVNMHIEQLMPQEYAATHHKYVHSYLTHCQPRIMGTHGRIVPIQKSDGTRKPMLLQLSHVKDGFFASFVHVYDVPTICKQITQLNKLKDRSRKLRHILEYVNHDVRSHLTDMKLRSVDTVAGRRITSITQTLEMGINLSAMYINQYAFRLITVNYVHFFNHCVSKLDPEIYQVQTSFTDRLRQYDVYLDVSKFTVAIQNMLHFVEIYSGHSTIQCETTIRDGFEDGNVEDADDGNMVTICTKMWAAGFTLDATICRRLLDGFVDSKAGVERYTGMRLSIAKQIIMGHDGDIYCQKDRLGVIFTILFRTQVTERDAVYSDEEVEPIEDLVLILNSPRRTKSYTVLVVDDSTLTCKLLCRAIQKMDYTAAYVLSGVLAVEWLEDHHCDVVLIDRSMPVLDGIETARVIRARWPSVAIVGLTGDTMAPYVDEFMSVGASYVLSKPFDVDQIETVLNSVMAT